MEFSVFQDQENANNVSRGNKEKNVPPVRDVRPKRRSVLGVLNAKQPVVNRQAPPKSKVGTDVRSWQSCRLLMYTPVDACKYFIVPVSSAYYRKCRVIFILDWRLSIFSHRNNRDRSPNNRLNFDISVTIYLYKKVFIRNCVPGFFSRNLLIYNSSLTETFSMVLVDRLCSHSPQGFDSNFNPFIRSYCTIFFFLTLNLSSLSINSYNIPTIRYVFLKKDKVNGLKLFMCLV